jgi:citrate lyase beta subunit
MSAGAARSLLYVPASRPRMLARLASIEVDLPVVDLEDGVAPADKDPARTRVREAARSGTFRGFGEWTLRVNGFDRPEHGADLDLADEIGAPRVLLPKAEDVRTVAALADRLARRGATLGLMLETPAGIGRARELAGCHPAIDLLVYGSADLRRALGASPDPERRWEQHALAEILLAARMHGCRAIDAVWFRFRDPDGLVREARLARDLGYDGKSCIHPDQIEPVHRVFAPRVDEIAWARSVLGAWREQDGERRGIVVADGGEMIEALHVELARRILTRAGETP